MSGDLSVDRMVRWVLFRLEGGLLTEHPDDRGGRTKWGVTERLWRAWTGAPRDARMPEDLTLDDAVACVMAMIIQPARLDRLADARVRLVSVDWAIHSGPSAPVRALQRYAGTPPAGGLDDATAAAVNAADATRVVGWLIGARLDHLVRIVRHSPTQRAFVVGWMHRIAAVAGEIGRDLVEVRATR